MQAPEPVLELCEVEPVVAPVAPVAPVAVELAAVVEPPVVVVAPVAALPPVPVDESPQAVPNASIPRVTISTCRMRPRCTRLG